MKWSEAITLEFVKIYLKNECLWNPVHQSYKSRSEREKSYWAIISEFRASTSKTLTVPEVKTKIKNLRTTYIEQVHKIIERSNPDNIYEPSLVWFHEMDKYLKNIPNKRQSTLYVTNELGRQVQNVDDVESCLSWVTQENTIENALQNEPEFSLASTAEPINSLLEKRLRLKKENQFNPIHKKRKNKKFKKSTQDCASDSESGAKEDEFDIYGKYIASQLRTMELQKALRLQLAIQNLVSEARISDILCND